MGSVSRWKENPILLFSLVGTVSLISLVESLWQKKNGDLLVQSALFSREKTVNIYFFSGSVGFIAVRLLLEKNPALMVIQVVALSLLLLGVGLKFSLLGTKTNLYNSLREWEYIHSILEGDVEKRRDMIVYDTYQKIDFFVTALFFCSVVHFAKKIILKSKEFQGVSLALATIFYLSGWFVGHLIDVSGIERKYFIVQGR